MRRFAAGKIPAKLAVLDDVDTLRGNALVIVGKRSQPGPMFQPRIRNHVDDWRSVFQVVELIERQKTCAGEIRFLSQNTIERPARLRTGRRPNRDPRQAPARRIPARLACPGAVERPIPELCQPGMLTGRHCSRGAVAAHERERELLRDALAALARGARRDAEPARLAAVRLGRRTADLVDPVDGSIAFVRERKGYGQLMIVRQGKVLGPLVQLGYQLGFYGHHDWGLAWAK